MLSTRISLLQFLREGNFEAWQELDQIYRPLIVNCLRQYSLRSEDVEDIAQEVMTCLVQKIPRFEHNGQTGAFRNWLRTTTANVARNHIRKKNIVGTGSSSIQEMIGQLEDHSSGPARQFDRDHDRLIVQRLLQFAAEQFTSQTLTIFRMHVLGGITAQETATQLGVSNASVHSAKSRVLRWLREQSADWIDDVYFKK